ncbi:MAG: hypothetical protein AAGH65_05350 [Pseudomonadota bacterium]
MLSTIERCWLVSIRVAWRFKNDPKPVAPLIDQLLEHHGLQPASCCIIRLIESLQLSGAADLYVERIIHPEPTGDEMDLLTALRCCYLEDPLGAEYALSALLPPGAGEQSLRSIQDIAIAHRLNMPCHHPFSMDWPELRPPHLAARQTKLDQPASSARPTIRPPAQNDLH